MLVEPARRGDVQLAADNGLPPPQVAILLQQWPAGSGSAVLYANQWRAAHFQHRPDFVSPAALQDPAALFYVAAILARRLDGANQALVELKSEIEDKPRSVIGETIKKMEKLLGASGANLGLYSGYSYNPLA